MTEVYYPLIEHNPELLRAFSGRVLSEIIFDTVSNDELAADDLRIHADTLRLQAQVARAAGYDQLAANLLRAAELTVVPNREVLQIYELLRPGRASGEQLHQLAEHLEQTYGAVETAQFIHEAAQVYQARGLVRR